MNTEPTIKDILVGVKRRVSTPDAWIKGCSARTTSGAAVYSESPLAVCWCLGGAITAEICAHYGSDWIKVGGVFEASRLDTAVRGKICTVAGAPSVVGFNDAPETQHADVMRILDKAIAVI